MSENRFETPNTAQEPLKIRNRKGTEDFDLDEELAEH